MSSVSLMVGEFGVSATVIRKAIRTLGYKPFVCRNMQVLTLNHMERRVEFCEAIERLGLSYVRRVFWSDELVWFGLNISIE